MTQAQVQVSINSGAWVSGAISGVPFGATVAFQNATSTGIRSYVWELLDYPPGLTLPAGWSNNGGVYTSNSPTPQTITLPASGSSNWGKIAVRLRLNGNPLQFDATGALQQSYVPSLSDTTTMLSVASPNMSMPGLAFSESTQFDAMRSWVGAVMANLRAIDSGGGGGGAPYINTLNDASFSFASLGGGNTTAYQSFIQFYNQSTARTVTFPASPFSGQRITVTVDNQCSSSNTLSLNPQSNLFIHMSTVGSGLTQDNSTQVIMKNHWESGTWEWNATLACWVMVAWVFSTGSP